MVGGSVARVDSTSTVPLSSPVSLTAVTPATATTAAAAATSAALRGLRLRPAGSRATRRSAGSSGRAGAGGRASPAARRPARRRVSRSWWGARAFTALDGVVDPGVGDWHFRYFNEEMGKAVDGTHDADVMLFGRVTYDSFAGAWPDREAADEEDAEFAKRLGDMRKIVASRSPREFTWRNSEQLQGDLVEAVTALRIYPAIRRIALSGSVSVVRQLLDAGLLDDLGARATDAWEPTS